MKPFPFCYFFLLACSVCSAQTDRISWPMINGDAMHTSYTQMHLEFPLSITRTLDVGYDHEEGMAVAENRLFISDYANLNTLVVADVMTGDVLWSFEIPGTSGAMQCIAAISEGVVVIGGQSGAGLYALDVETGDSLWLLPVGSLYTRSPVISEGRVYQLSFDSLNCVDLHTGQILWTFIESMPQTSPAVDDARVYTASRANMYAFDKITGDTAWINDSVDVGSFMSIAVDGQHVYTGHRRSISALNKLTGGVSWHFTLGDTALLFETPGAFAQTTDHLLVKFMVTGNANGQYLVLDKSTGQELNRYEGVPFIYSAPTIVNDYVVDYSNGHIQFLDLLSGVQVYEMTNVPISGDYSQVIAADDKIYLAGNGPNVLVLESMPSSVYEVSSDLALSIYPNPVDSKTTVAFTLEEKSAVALRILAPSGVTVANKKLGTFTPGEHLLSIPVDDLCPGIYLIQLQSTEGMAVRKMSVF